MEHEEAYDADVARANDDLSETEKNPRLFITRIVTAAAARQLSALNFVIVQIVRR